MFGSYSIVRLVISRIISIGRKTKLTELHEIYPLNPNKIRTLQLPLKKDERTKQKEISPFPMFTFTLIPFTTEKGGYSGTSSLPCWSGGLSTPLLQSRSSSVLPNLVIVSLLSVKEFCPNMTPSLFVFVRLGLVPTPFKRQEIIGGI